MTYKHTYTIIFRLRTLSRRSRRKFISEGEIENQFMIYVVFHNYFPADHSHDIYIYEIQ
jgi:hypothetical protein